MEGPEESHDLHVFLWNIGHLYMIEKLSGFRVWLVTVARHVVGKFDHVERIQMSVFMCDKVNDDEMCTL